MLAEDDVWLPYAVEVEGQIITIYDPAIHIRVPDGEPEIRDERWVLCNRPAVLVGGELTVEMLDLQFNPTDKILRWPGADEGQQRRADHRRLRTPAPAP